MSEMDVQRGSSRFDVVQEPLAEEPGKATLAQQAHARIKEDIFEFRMPPGQRYSEQELASRLGISRTPLRFALHVLAREGYLVRLDGHACWQVKPFDLSYYEDLYDFRTELEMIAVRRLCALPAAPDLGELCAFWLAPEAERDADGARVGAEDEKFHSTLVALAGNAEMQRTHAGLTERIRIIRRLDFIGGPRIDAAFEEHAGILRALMARDAQAAAALVQGHIGASRVEISRITLQRLAEATARGAAARTA